MVMTRRLFRFRPQIELLEDRNCPSVAYLDGTLFITDPSNRNDNIQVAPAANGGAEVSSNLGSGNFGPVDAVVVNLGSGNDNVRIGSLPGATVNVTVLNGNDNIAIGKEVSILVTAGEGNNNIQTGNASPTQISVTGNGNNNIQAAGTGDSIEVVGNGHNNIMDTGSNDVINLNGNGNNNIDNQGQGSYTYLVGTGHNHLRGVEAFAINTTISAHLTSLTSAGGSTAGTINSGLLQGTTQFSATFTDAQLDYVGTLVITTADGSTLTLADQGNLNAATGAFVDHLTVSSGTGRFAGASGTLFDQGTLDLQTGTFANVPLTGVIFVPQEQSAAEDRESEPAAELLRYGTTAPNLATDGPPQTRIPAEDAGKEKF
jgi:hypothetical protein